MMVRWMINIIGKKQNPKSSIISFTQVILNEAYLIIYLKRYVETLDFFIPPLLCAINKNREKRAVSLMIVTYH